MPPASKRDCSVILFDLAAENSAKQALIKICCNNYFTASKDLTKLVLLNSNVTENRLNAHYGGYDNIHEVAKDIAGYNPKRILEMIEENSERGEANWLEGLFVALKNLEEEFQDIGGVVTYQVLFITDFKTLLGEYDQSLVDKIIRSIVKRDVFLYVVGPNVEPPFTIKNRNDLKKWQQNLDVDPNNENLSVLKKIIQETENSLVCSYKLGVHLFFSFRNWGGSQPWQVPLAVGSKIQLPTQTVKVLDKELKCKLVRAQGTFGFPTWIDAEDESIEIDPSDVISGLMRHEKFIQMPENKMFQVENPRGFSVLCFTDSVNVPEYLMRSEGCYQVLANSTPERNESFNILVDSLAKQNKYVIARRIYNNNFAPKIVVLVPKPDYNPKSFLLANLPFEENLRVNYKEKNCENAPKIDTSEEVYNFLESVNIDGGMSTKPLLGITMMQNFNTQKIINKAADKILDQHTMLDDLDLNVLQPPSGAGLEALKEIWTERSLKEEKVAKAEAENDNEESDNDFDW